MKRPVLITTVTLTQLLLALILAGTGIYVWLQTRSPEILSQSDREDTIRGLTIGAISLVVPALILLVGVYGLWQHKLWGWWLAVVVGLAIDGILIYSVFEDGWAEAERDDIVMAVCFAVFPILMFLPRVVKFFWNRGTPDRAEEAVTQGTPT